MALRIRKDWLLTMQMIDEMLKRIGEILYRDPEKSKGKQVRADYEFNIERIYRLIDGTLRWVVL